MMSIPGARNRPLTAHIIKIGELLHPLTQTYKTPPDNPGGHTGNRPYRRPVRHMTNRNGFTLLELMTVIAIVGILAAIAVPSFQKSIIRAREASLRNSLFVMRDVIDQYYADHGRYPPTLEALVEKKYIRSIPMDPFTGSTQTWILIAPQGEEATGIYDVHSGSDRVSLSGIPYNEW